MPYSVGAMMHRPPRILLVASALAALCACTARDPVVVPAETPVILVVIDTLRADRLGCYGYPLDTSPRLDAFAERAFLFEANSTQLNSTFGSLTSIFTGLYPKSHQMFLPVPTAAALESAPDGMSLTERLAARGDYRLGVVSHPSFGETDARAILMRGWDEFSVIDPQLPIAERIFCAHGADTNARLFPRLDRAIEAAGGRPVFVWAHYFDPHTERYDLVYNAPEATRNLFLRSHLAGIGREDLTDELGAIPPMERLEWIRRHARGTTDLRLANGRALYDAEVRSCDAHVGELFDRLRERDLFDRSLIVVMADHGENLGLVDDPPRGAAFTHQRLFDGVMHTPLLVKLPHQRTGRRIAAITQNIDVMPTLVELLGLDAGAAVDGRSLVPLLRGDARAVHDRVFMESSDGIERAVRTDVFKYIDPGDGAPLLFRWRDDPLERENLVGEIDAEKVGSLADALDAFTPSTGTFVRLTPAEGAYRAKITATLDGVAWRDAAGVGLGVEDGVLRWEGTVAAAQVDLAFFHSRSSSAIRFRVEIDRPGRVDEAVYLGDVPLARSPVVPRWTLEGGAPSFPLLRIATQGTKVRLIAGDDLPPGASVVLRPRVPSYRTSLEAKNVRGFEVTTEGITGMEMVLKERGGSALVTRGAESEIDVVCSVDGAWIDPRRVAWGANGLSAREIEFELPRRPSVELLAALARDFDGGVAPPGTIQIRSTAGELVTEIDRAALDPELVRQLQELGYLK